MTSKQFASIFLALSIVHVGAELLSILQPDLRWTIYLRYATKPLLMPLLVGYFIKSLNGKLGAQHKLMIAGFAFSWLGDISLMFASKINFLLGLVSFLTTHVLYIVAFTKDFKNNPEATIIKRRPYVAIPLLMAIGLLMFLLTPKLGEMLIPVSVYTSVITIMVLTALNRYGKVSLDSFQWVYWGAFIFMVSDTMIAVNKFYMPFEISRVTIMTTYLGGQFMIAKGMLETNK